MGCSQSTVELLTIAPIDTKPELPVSEQRSRSNQPSNRIVENFIIVWFLHDSSVNVENEKVQLRHIVSWIKTFTDSNECVTYITNIRIEKIFLIVPDMGSWLQSIENLPQIEKIYVLSSSLQRNDKHEGRSSLPDTFYDIDTVCKQLRMDTELCELDLFYITAAPVSIRDSNTSSELKKQDASFRCAQLMREILFRLKFESNAKNEFVNFFRIHYENDDEQLRIIDDFESSYRSQKALSWLIRPCFIWRVMQRIQRTQEIDIHYKIGFFVKNVYAQLNIFQDNHLCNAEKTWIVYRGKTMINEQFETLIKNNCGGLLSIAAFWTANTDEKIAINFVCSRLALCPHVTGVLFEIHINPGIRSTRSPLASLEEIHSKEINGIFFSPYTVFRIESVQQITEQSIIMWTVKLTLIADDDPQLLRIVSPLRSSEVHTDPLSYMGKLFMDKGDYEEAEQFFLGILQDTSVLNQPRRLMRVHKGLGTNYMNKSEYGRALEHYQQALDAALSYLSLEHTDLVPLYDGIGNSYFKLGNYLNAILNYEKAASLLTHAKQPVNEQLVNDLNSRINNAKKLLNNKQ